MEQEHFDEAEYIRGFNLGYQVMKQYPEMGEVIANSHLKGDKFDGINDGRSQYLEELIIDQDKTQELVQAKVRTEDPLKQKSSDKETDNRPSWLSGDRLSDHINTDEKEFGQHRDIDKEDQ